MQPSRRIGIGYCTNPGIFAILEAREIASTIITEGKEIKGNIFNNGSSSEFVYPSPLFELVTFNLSELSNGLLLTSH